MWIGERGGQRFLRKEGRRYGGAKSYYWGIVAKKNKVKYGKPSWVSGTGRDASQEFSKIGKEPKKKIARLKGCNNTNRV